MNEGRIISAPNFDDFLADYDGTAHVHVNGTQNTTENFTESETAREYSWDNPAPEYQTQAHSQSVDASGTAFDPRIHGTDKHGQPRLTKNGNFRKRRGAAKNPNDFAPHVNIPGQGALTLDDPSPLAKTAALAYIQAGVMFFGEEWLPDPVKKEQEFLTEAWHDFFVAHDMDDLPPGLALVVACAAYAAPRVHRPNTQSKLRKFSMWTQIKVYTLYYRLRHGTWINYRPDTMRKNNAGETPNQGSEKPRRSFFGFGPVRQ